MSFFILGVANVFSQTILLKIVSYFLNDKQITFIGFVLFSLGLICIALSANNILIYFTIFLYGLSAISNSSIMSIISSQVLDSKQGQLMGALESIASFWSVLGPILATNLYYYTTNLALPLSDGYPYIFATMIVLISLFPLYFGLKRVN